MSLQSIGNIAQLGKIAQFQKGTSLENNALNVIGDLIKGKSYKDAVSMMTTAGLSDEFQEIALSAAKIKQPAEDAAEAITGIGKTSSFIDGLKLAFEGLFSVIKAHPIITAIIGITTALIAAKKIYDSVTISQEEYIEKGEKAQDAISESFSTFKKGRESLKSLANSYADSTDEIETQSDAIESLTKKYAELKRGVDSQNENTSLSDEGYQNYIDISNQLAQLYPELVYGYDAQGNAILNLSSNADKAAESVKKLYEAQQLSANMDIANNIQDVYNGVNAQIDKYEKILQNYKYQQENVSSNIESLKETETTGFSLEDGKFIYNPNVFDPDTANQFYNKIRKLINDEYNSVQDRQTEDGLIEVYSPFTKIDKETFDSWNKELQVYYDKANKTLAAEQNQIEKNIDTTNLLIEGQQKIKTTLISDYLQTSDIFTNLNSDIQNAFLSNLTDLDLSKLEDKNQHDDKVMSWLHNEFITPMSQFSDEAQAILSKAIQLDPAEFSTSDYKDKITSYLKEVFPNDTETQNIFSQALGFDKVISENEQTIDELLEYYYSKVKDMNILKSIKELTGEDLELILEIKAKDGYTGTFQDLMDKVEELRKKAEEPIDIYATPQMDKIEKAIEKDNDGANYEKIVEYIEKARELYNKGLVGTDDFKEIAALLSPTGMTDATNFEENIGKMMKYFDTDSADGVKAFLSDLESLNKGYVDLDKSTGKYLLNFSDLQQAASDMGMSFEAFMAVLQRLNDYGFTNDMFSSTDEGFRHLSDLYSQLTEQEMKLMELTDNDGIMDGNQTAIQATKDKIDELNLSISTTLGYLDQLSQKEASDYNNEVDAAYQAIGSRLKAYEEAGKYKNSEEVRKTILEDIQNTAGKYHIDLSKYITFDDDGMILEVSSDFMSQLQSDINGYPINVPIQPSLTDRPIDISKTQVVSSRDGTKSLVVTPILPDGTVLTEYQLDKYIQKALSGEDSEITLATFSGEDSAEQAALWQNTFSIIEESCSDATSNMKDQFDILKNYSLEELQSITLNDDSYDEGLEEAEKAIDSMLEKIGLTSEQSGILLQTLQQLGLLENVELNIEPKNPGEVVQKEQEYADTNPVEIKTVPEVQTRENSISGYTEGTRGSTQSDNTTYNLPPKTKEEQTLDATVNIDTESAYNSLQDYFNEHPLTLTTSLAGFGADLFSSDLDSTDSVTIATEGDTTGLLEANEEAVEEIENDPAVKDIDGNTAKILYKDQAVTSEIETEAVKPISADTSKLESKINSVLDKEYTLTINTNIAGSSGGNTVEKRASGTPFIRSGHFNNGVLGQAFAYGTVGEPKNTEALTGELGQELVVRGNRFFTVGDNGPEFFNLKKGDIVFNAKQTQELLSKGKTRTHGRALASGNARALGGKTGGFQGGANGKTIEENGVLSSTQSNTVAQQANTEATNENTKAAEKATEEFNWVERRLKYFSEKTKAIADSITDYVTSTFKASQLKKQISAIGKEITANKKGAATYKKKAESVAKSYQYESDGNTITVSIPDNYVKQVQSGKWNIEDMDTSTPEKKALAEAIQKYQDWYDKMKDCQQSVVDLKNEQLELFDQWANMPLEEAEKRLESYTKKVDNLSNAYSSVATGASAISKLKVLNETKTQENINKATKENDSALNAQKKATSNREAKGDTLLSKLSKNKKLKTATKNKIKSAVSSGKSLSSSTLEQLKAAGLSKYASAYNKTVKAETSAKSKVSKTSEALRIAMETTPSEQILNNYSVNDLTYLAQNALIDEEMTNRKHQVNVKNDAVAKTQKNLVTYEAKKKKADNAKASAKKTLDKKKSAINTKYLSSSQKSALKSGKKVSEKGIKDKKTLKAVQAYNKALDDYKKKSDAATTANQKYNITLKANEEATYNAAEAQQDLAQSVVDAAKQSVENIKNYYDAFMNLEKAMQSSIEAKVSIKQSEGYDLVSSDFQKQIDSMKKQKDILDKQASEMEKELNNQVTKGRIVVGSEEYKELQTEIINLRTESDNLTVSIHEQADAMRKNLFVAYERAYEAAEKLRSSYSTLQDLINDDMNFDDNGRWTNMGLLNLGTQLETIKSDNSTLQTLLKERADYIAKYNNGSDLEYTKKEFDEDMQDWTDRYRDALSKSSSDTKAFIDLLEKQAKAELDALNKVIDKHTEALQKKKNYYDYDKQLKNKTKEIQSLEAQIRALDGVTDAESRARKARLEAQREEAQQELDDTVRDHVVDLQVNGLNDLKDQLQENYDDYCKQMNSNLGSIADAIEKVRTMIDKNSVVLKDAANILVEAFGGGKNNASLLNYTSSNKYASGTSRVPKNMWALTQERGFDLMTHNGGIMTPLSKGDGVINHELTERLLNMAYDYPYILTQGIDSSALSRISKIDTGSINPVIQCPITIQGNASEQDVINALNKAMPSINKKVQESIRRDLRKAGW